MLMVIAKARKKPWIAALLALVLGGPACFYLGWRYGVKATLGWMFALPLPLVGLVTELAKGQNGTLEFAIMFLFVLHGALAWLAYRSCQRLNAGGAKNEENPEPDSIQRAQAKCVQEIRNTGLQVIVLSGIALVGGVMCYVNTSPPMGGFGRFAHGFALVLTVISVWGVATGLGLKRACRWAWISMLIFGGLLTATSALLILPFLLTLGEGIGSWHVTVIGVLTFLPPAGIGFWWFRFFLRTNVRSYFGIARNASGV